MVALKKTMFVDPKGSFPVNLSKVVEVKLAD